VNHRVTNDLLALEVEGIAFALTCRADAAIAVSGHFPVFM